MTVFFQFRLRFFAPDTESQGFGHSYFYWDFGHFRLRTEAGRACIRHAISRDQHDLVVLVLACLGAVVLLVILTHGGNI